MGAGSVLNGRLRNGQQEPFAPLHSGDQYQADGLQMAAQAFAAAAQARGPLINDPSVRAAVDRPHAGHYSSLAGKYLPAEDAFHGNMVPFFGQRVKQSMDPNANTTILETYTGAAGTQCQKREQASFTDNVPAPVNGMGSVTDFMQSRQLASRTYNNMQPFEQVRVGPGLGAGFTDRPSGGFHDFSIQHAVMPKNIDELRTDSKPKLTYEGRTLPATAAAQRGIIPGPVQYKADRFFTECQREQLPTRATITAQKSVPITFLKPTDRGFAEGYIAPAPAPVPMAGDDGEATAMRRKQQEACEPPMGGLYTAQGPSDDYGRAAIDAGPSVREYMHVPSRPGLITSLVKAITSPLSDAPRAGLKDLYLLPARDFGVGVQAQMPAKPTTYDPSDATRTTIKETLIHDVHEGYLTGPRCIYEYNGNEVRTTMKQTLGNAEAANLRARNKGKLGPTEKARTTLRETVIREGTLGAAQGPTKPGDTSFIVRAQNRETMQDEYMGAADRAGAGGYEVAPADAPFTTRELQNEHFGPAQSAHVAGMVQDADRAARVNDHREIVLQGRMPTLSGPKGFLGGSEAIVETAPKDRCVGQLSMPLERVMQEPPTTSGVNLTQDRNVYMEQGRLDPAILSALSDNPFIPLN
jgi:hypothetical protein